jgi:C-terminal processing protease CtpA/Prc
MKLMDYSKSNMSKKLISINNKKASVGDNQTDELLSESADILSTSYSSNQSSYDTNELCMLLSKFDVQNIFSAHDQIATRYDEQSKKMQKLNKELMIEQQQQLQNQQRRQQQQPQSQFQQQQQQQQQQQFMINSEEKEFELTNVNGDEFALINTIDNLNEHDENVLSDEGKFLLSKAQQYCVENLKLVNIEKPEAPLGATIRNKDGCIVIGRIVVGGAAEQSGLLHEDDEILEINNIPVRGKTIDDVCEMLVRINLVNFKSAC